jgi:hypothetical protein
MASKKNQPMWVMNDLPEPPIVNGYWDYGTVWSIYMHRPRFHYWRELGRSTYWALWSYYYWGKKVRKALRYTAADLVGLLRGRGWPSSPAKVTKGPGS